MKNRFFSVVSVLAFLLIATAIVNAQSINGSVSGTVTDAQGAIIPGASVTITHVETGAKREAVTNDEGRFVINGVTIGIYTVRVEKGGFASLVRDNVQVSVSQNADLELQMSAGQVEARVDVAAAGELLDTTQSQVSKVVNQQQILELPGRNALNGLALLNPGVLPNQNGRPGSGFAVNGNRTRSNNFTIDGANNNDQSLSIPRQSLPPEAIGEFQIITNTFAAEYGRNAGSYVNQLTRSGTNRFSGTGFYNWAGNGLDALTTNQSRIFNANKAAGLSDYDARHRARNVTNDTTYGFTLGGPVKKDHTFFFTSLDFNDFRTTISTVTRAAIDASSRACLQANRASFASQAAVDFILNTFPVANDPTLAGTSLAGSSVSVTGCTTAGGNPLVFRTFNRTLNQGLNYGTDFGRWLMKINTKINDKDQLSFRYLIDQLEDPGSPASLPGLELGQRSRNQSFTINDVYSLTSALLNEFRFTYSRRKIRFPENFTAFAAGNQVAIGGIPGNAFNGGNANFPQFRTDNVFELTDNVTYTNGNHNFKFGYNVLRYQLNNVFAPQSRGAIQYNSLTNFLNDVAASVANANGQFGMNAITYEHSWFAQDDWRVSPDLTLNLGLRYEYVTTPFGFFSNAKSDLNNLGPRVGFAYNPKEIFDGKFVLRGGFAISYDQIFQNILLNVSRNYPRVVNNSANCTGCAPFLGYANIPLTATSTQIPGGATPGVVRAYFTRNPSSVPTADIPFISERLFSANERIRQPMSTQWTGSLQYQLSNDYVIKAEYIGTRGTNLVREIEQNFGFAPPIGNNQRLNTARGSILVGQGIANSIYHAGQFTFEKRLTGVEILGKTLGRAQFNANYTFSSYISESDDVLGGQANRTIPADPRNPELDRARSGFDQPHRFVFSAIFETPDVLKSNAFFNRVFSGWQLSTITTLASGTPFSILSGPNAAGILPSQIATVTNSQRVGLLNPNGPANSFTTANAAGVPVDPNARYVIYPEGAGIFGSLGANTERTPSTYNTDLAVVKNIRTFGETQRLQIRMEVFNVFNHRNFNVIPTNTLFATTSPTSFLNYGLTNVAGRGFAFGARYFF